MKRILCLMLAVLLFATACTSSELPPITVTTRTTTTTTTALTTTTTAAPSNGTTIVYVTDTGECYHRESCGSLWNSRHSTTLKEACHRGYRACGRCSPPKLK